MTKHIIDDAMIRRLKNAMEMFDGTSESVRRMLDDTLNPPPEPEIVVTNAMVAAARATKPADWSGNYGWIGDDDICGVYRAMRKLEPKPVPPIKLHGREEALATAQKFGDSILTRADVQAKDREANAWMRCELDKAWAQFQRPYCLPWYQRMAGPNAVIPTTDPRGKDRRK